MRRSPLRWLGLALAGTLLPLGVGADEPTLPPPARATVDFARDIAPILAKNCHQCHGPEKQKGGLRLDAREPALTGGDSGPAIVVGKSDESPLIERVAGVEPSEVMPPKGERLGAEQVGLLRAWIDQGATWSDGAATDRASSRHWSFQPVRRPEVPTPRDAGRVHNPIDAFVLARLESERIAPSPEADRTTLVRRLSLDLTGLPPSPAEVDAFVHDDRPDAYERLVDRLLGSPHFGEQWARHWLDLARYADTDGYEKDLYRPHAWRWRDWVIDAFNRDLSFDRFTRDQVAGDLLPDATVEQRVATGFHRNTLLNREGGVDIEEDRVKGVVDRASTVGSVWLGLTVGCAECHSHKYDPITQREFYGLYAFFNSTDDRDIHAPLPSQAADLQRKREALTAAQRRYLASHPLDPGFEHWAEEVAALPKVWTTLESYELPTFGANNGANLYPQEDGSFLVTGMVNNNTHYIMMGNTPLRKITGVRVEPMADDMLPRGGPGWADNGNFVISELKVEASPLSDVTRLKPCAVGRVTVDYEQPGFEVARSIDGDDKTGWAIDLPHLPRHGVDRAAVFELKDDVGFEGGTRLKISLVQHNGKSHTLGRVRVTITTADRSSLGRQAVPSRIRDLARIPAGRRTLEQDMSLRRYYHATYKPHDPRLLDISRALHELAEAEGATRAQALAERSIPRPTHIHVRGDFLNKGPEVQPGTPAVLHGLKPRGPRADRIDLANWLTEPANPLTARVTVNRVWGHLFGQGLVTTVSDFGTQGERPSHPELLDWLASEFVREAWSVKALIRRIVTSSTYRQSSRHRPDLATRDAKNRLLARQNRFRLSAENVRDQYLAASGLLDRRVGGPSVGVESKRRGLYVQFKRAHPEAMLVTFDAPSSTVTCPLRERSNTPLQALTLMNDPLYVECARGLARRVVAEAKDDLTDRVRHAFRLVLAREPDAEEVADLTDLYGRVHDLYQADPSSATQVAGKGMPAGVLAPEAAAWVVVGRAILNLDELIVRE